MPLQAIRSVRPRLYRPADDPDYRFTPPSDPVRRRILDNMLADCHAWAGRRPWRRIPERPASPHPFHQLYITFYSAMQAAALIEHYAFAWRLSGDGRWLERGREWLLAAVRWEHGDRLEEHFYTANRYMHALAVGLDLLGEALTERQEERVTQVLVRLTERWWPEVEAGQASTEGGHHAVVDNGHFGVAALQLLGVHGQAPAWVEAVVRRFRTAIMPHGCGPRGEPVDGPTFWPWENLWMLQFADALRHVTGVDLAAQFPQRLRRPLLWFRYHLAAPAGIADAPYYPPNANVLTGSQLDACSPVLLRLAGECGDGEMLRVALGDPRLGRLYSFATGVKGSAAECILAGGPYAYCWAPPSTGLPGPDSGRRQRARASAVGPGSRRLPLARRFAARYGESAVLRSGWDSTSLIACVCGYRGGAPHGFSHLHLQWAGHPVLRTLSCREGQPVTCGSLPCVGGENEVVSFLGRLERCGDAQRLAVRSRRLDQEYWLLGGDPPLLLAALRRRPRRLRVRQEDGQACVRLEDEDWLQYPRLPDFGPQAGHVRLRVRLRRPVDPDRPQVLFGVGLGVAGLRGTQVNLFSLGFLEGAQLAFAVQSQGYHRVEVRLPAALLQPGQWHDVSAAWGGLGAQAGRPFLEVGVDGQRQRLDEAVRFAEVGAEIHGLERTRPRPFRIHPNTGLAFGAAGQIPGTGVACDLARLELGRPGRRPLVLTFPEGLRKETGSGPLVWKLNPADLREVDGRRACFGAGPRALSVIPVWPPQATLAVERVPFAPAGLAGASLRSLAPGAGQSGVRVLAEAGAGQDCLVLAFVDRAAAARVRCEADGVRLCVGTAEYCFGFNTGARGQILTPR
ncbi:MAG: hypothetical protein AB1505_00030 [Candidatus Latescibacterota bacterium]